MKLSQWAKKNGLTYQTAFNLFKKDQLPGKITQLPSGTILIEDESTEIKKELKTYVYCRVSNSSKKDDLSRQEEKCIKFCEDQGWQVEKIIKEVAPDTSENRKQFNLILDKNPKRIVVESKEKISKFGFDYLNKLLNNLGYEIVVLSKDEIDHQDMIHEFLYLISSFANKVYGQEKGEEKIKYIKEVLMFDE